MCWRSARKPLRRRQARPRAADLSDQGLFADDSDRRCESPPAIACLDEHNLVAISRFRDRLRVTATAEFAGYDASHRPSDFAFMKRVTQGSFPTAPSTIGPKCGRACGR